MAFTFPSSPATNDTYTVGSRTYTWTGTKWVLSGGVITSTQLEANSVTTAKILNSAVTTAKINNNAVTQEKLSANLSAVTVTTTANRGTDVPSPFTGQLVFLTDTKKIQVWDGTAWLNITLAPPETPTSLSAVASTTSVAISFTLGADNGSAITNHKYALSTDGGSTYGSFIALNPVDITSPITISGLSMNTEYYVKIKTVNGIGDSVASSAVSFTTEGVPGAPTSLSASNVTGSSVNIAFTAGAANGASITNYKYAVSTDNVTYGAFTALSPTDASTPITVTGLTAGTLQYIKLKAVNSNGDSAASAAVSFTTLPTLSIDALLVGGGGGGGGVGGGDPGGNGSGGGGGGQVATLSTAILAGDTYTITVGGGGSSSSAFSTTVVRGGNGGGAGLGSTGYNSEAGQYNSGGGGGNAGASSGTNRTGGSGGGGATAGGGGGAGDGANGSSGSGPTGGNGGNGTLSNITGSSTYYAGGGGGGRSAGAGGGGGGGAGGAGGGATGCYSPDSPPAATPNTGGGGAGGTFNNCGSGGGASGVVIFRALTSAISQRTVTTTGSPTVTTSGSYTVYKYTGSGTFNWS